MGTRKRGFTLIELLVVVAIIGILAAVAIPNLIVAIQRAKQKRTMNDMRNLATAWEARATDFAKYNAAGAGYDIATTLVSTDDVVAMLQPTYIKAAPAKDGWQRPYHLFLDKPIGGTSAQRYVIQSAGRDGLFEDVPTEGPVTNFDCDLVYSNGVFISYPPQ